MALVDFYKTLQNPSEPILFKEKHSKFYGYAFPVEDEESIRHHLDQLKKEHPGAVHYCYAWQLGTNTFRYRVNDDGEPAHTAGTPIYGQIQSFGLTNVLVVIVRFFGGIKLGVGGLITAYRTAAQMAIEQAEIVEKPITQKLEISFGYANLNKAMRIIKEKNLEIALQEMALDCKIVLLVRASQMEAARQAFESVFGIAVKDPD
ncbi:MAG TPA: YigZ family protein [Flavobacterium sp.]|nr:YigZ family protein [Flavobacterium sp.]